MKTELLKREIENFLNELDIRKNEIEAGILENKTQIGKSIYDFARLHFSTDDFPMIYSTNGIRLDIIFHISNKTSLHCGSNRKDVIRLCQAVKYEILANKNKYENISLEDFYYIYWGYLIRLSKNFNWGCTYNEVNEFNIKLAPTYLEWRKELDIFSNDTVKALYANIFINNDNTVTDILGNKKEINIKNIEYKMKRLSKEQIIEMIELFDHKPTIKEITEYYLSTLDKEAEDYRENYVSKENMRNYINGYELNDMIKTCNHTESFKNKKQ